MKRLLVAQPDGRVMQAWSAIAAPLLGRPFQNEVEIHSLSTLRDTLLLKLIFGELRLTDAERCVEAALRRSNFSRAVAARLCSNRQVRVDVRLDRETVWLSQKQIAGLFNTSTDNVGLHLKNIYAEGELSEGATAEGSSVVQTEGRRKVRRQVRHYNLDAILSFGYRVSTKRRTREDETP